MRRQWTLDSRSHRRWGELQGCVHSLSLSCTSPSGTTASARSRATPNW